MATDCKAVNATVQETAAQRTHCRSNSYSHSGSIYGVGRRFQLFRINNLEMVDQNSVSWNRVVQWMRQLESLSRAS